MSASLQPGSDGTKPSIGPRTQLLGVALILAAWVLLLHGHVLDDWWSRDDSLILAFVQQHTPWEWFSSATVWRELSPANFTPLLALSYEVDLALFGLEPTGFYAHTLLMLTLTLLAGFGLLRNWLGAGWALSFTLIFALTTPVLVEIHGLPRRHYVEGLLFATLAAYFHIDAVRSNRPRRAWLGACFYALAFLSKELFLPLVAVLPWLAVGPVRRRWLFTLPSVLVALLCLLWRRTMLGVTVGGTGRAIDLDALAQLPARVARLSFGSDTLGTLASVLCVGLLLSFFVRRRRARMATFVIAGCAVAPLAFILPLGTPKLLLLVVWLLLIAALAELAALHARGGAARLFALSGVLLLGLAAGAQSRAQHPALDADLRAFEVQGRFMMEAQASQILWTTLPDHFPRHLAQLRSELYGETAPLFVSDELMLDGVDITRRSVVEYDAQQDELRDITGAVAQRMAAWRDARQARELSVDMVVRDGRVHWQFGPWTHGQWRLVEHDRFGTREVGRSGVGRVNLTDTLDFHVRHDSPRGWVTYSDRLSLRLEEGAQLQWRRAAFLTSPQSDD